MTRLFCLLPDVTKSTFIVGDVEYNRLSDTHGRPYREVYDGLQPEQSHRSTNRDSRNNFPSNFLDHHAHSSETWQPHHTASPIV